MLHLSLYQPRQDLMKIPAAKLHRRQRVVYMEHRLTLMRHLHQNSIQMDWIQLRLLRFKQLKESSMEKTLKPIRFHRSPLLKDNCQNSATKCTINIFSREGLAQKDNLGPPASKSQLSNGVVASARSTCTSLPRSCVYSQTSKSATYLWACG